MLSDTEVPDDSSCNRDRAADPERISGGRFPVYERLAADIDVMRYLGGKTMNQVEAWRHMAFMIGHWTLRGYGYFAVEEKTTREFIGRAGFMNPTGWPGFELGWTIAPWKQRKGFASEAARRLLDYAFVELVVARSS